MEPGDSNGWHEYSRLVLNELKRLDKDIKEIDSHLRQISLDIATLKAKSAMWGAVAGAIPGIIIALMQLFVTK